MIVETLAVGEIQANCYLVGDEATRQAMVIDPGEEPARILQEIARLRLTVTLIVNTHGHFDHILANGPLKEATGARTAIHQADLPLIERAPEGALLWFGRRVPPPPKPDILLADGDELTVGELSFTVLHTPGHSPGSICLLSGRTVFTGDTLFNLGIGRYDLPGGNYEQLQRSLSEKLMALPDETTVYPGHGPATTIAHERLRNPFLAR